MAMHADAHGQELQHNIWQAYPPREQLVTIGEFCPAGTAHRSIGICSTFCGSASICGAVHCGRRRSTHARQGLRAGTPVMSTEETTMPPMRINEINFDEITSLLFQLEDVDHYEPRSFTDQSAEQSASEPPTPPSWANGMVSPPGLDQLFIVSPRDFDLDDARVPATPAPTPDHSGQSSPQNLSNPASPGTSPGSFKGPSTTRQKIPRHKRESHIKAEYRRRNKIQNGFDELKSMVPTITEVVSGGNKDSKASMLSKTADFIRQLRGEYKELKSQAEQLRNERAALSAEIRQFQSQLPAEGLQAPEPEPSLPVQNMYDDYVKARVYQDWTFWIFSMVTDRLFESYKTSLNTADAEVFQQSLMQWLDKHCSLVALRPLFLNAVHSLSTKTSVMTTPEKLPQEALMAIMSASQPTKSTKDGASAAETGDVQPMETQPSV